MISPVVAAAVGLLMTAGVLGIAFGAIRGTPEPQAGAHRSAGAMWARITKRPAGVAGRRRDLLLVASLLVGLVVAGGTGWLISVALIPAAVLGLPALLKIPKARDVVLLEALDRWVRTLTATLPTGKSITDAIRLSRRTAPETIAQPLGLLIARLNNRWDTRDALMQFADDLDSPDADGVIAALILAAHRGSNGAAATLGALADSLQAQLRARRLIEVERAKPYIVVRQVTVISLLTLGMAFVFGRGFFAPYGTPLGQVILSVLLSGYVASLILMRRRAAVRRRDRILVAAHR
jgi:Flp pilus assembly protein TadB